MFEEFRLPHPVPVCILALYWRERKHSKSYAPCALLDPGEQPGNIYGIDLVPNPYNKVQIRK